MKHPAQRCDTHLILVDAASGIRATPWTPEFMIAYDAAKNLVPPIEHKGINTGTWRWLCVKYFIESADYQQLDDRTKQVRRNILEATCREPIAPGSSKVFGDFPLTKMGTDAIEVLRDRKMAFPESANARVKAIRAVFKWAVGRKGSDGAALVLHNPARDVRYLKSNNPAGYHTWTIDEVQQFENRHPVGTKARLALALLLFTGQRRSDIIRFGRQHARGSKITFIQFKGRNRKPKRLVLPILPALQKIIDASPCGHMTFLMNDLGRPFTDAGFGNWFRDRCLEAGVPGRAHGLRKAGATIAAENGATASQLQAIFGWSSLRMASRYTEAADQERMAEAAMHLIEPRGQTGVHSDSKD
jgi:integrase